MKDPKFPCNTFIRHINTGRVYAVVFTTCKLENTAEDAYAYSVVPSGQPIEQIDLEVLWVRGRTDMEDGRFERVRMAKRDDGWVTL